MAEVVPVPFAGSMVAQLLEFAGDDLIPFARISYFAALAQIYHADDGGLEGVLDRTCRSILWASHNMASTDNDSKSTHTRRSVNSMKEGSKKLSGSPFRKLGWWKRQAYRMGGASHIETQVQEDGFAAAERAVQCIMNPKEKTRLYRVLDGDKQIGHDYALYEILAAATLKLPLPRAKELFQPDLVSMPQNLSLEEGQCSSSSVTTISSTAVTNEIWNLPPVPFPVGATISSHDVNNDSAIDSASSPLLSLKLDEEGTTTMDLVSREEHEAQSAKMTSLEAEVQRLKQKVRASEQQKEGSEGRQAMAFVNPTEELAKNKGKIVALEKEIAQLASQLHLVTTELHTVQDDQRQQERPDND